MSDWLANAIKQALEDREVKQAIVDYLTPDKEPVWREVWWKCSEETRLQSVNALGVHVEPESVQKVKAVIQVEYCETRYVARVRAIMYLASRIDDHWGGWRQYIGRIDLSPWISGFVLHDESLLCADYADAINRGLAVWPDILREFIARTKTIEEIAK